MTAKEGQRTLSLNPLLVVIVGTILLYLVVNFGRQVAVSHQREAELQRVQEQIAATETRQQELRLYLDSVKTDSAAEEWARIQGWAKEGEVPVIVVAPPATAPAVPEDALPPASPASYRQQWWELFFGSR